MVNVVIFWKEKKTIIVSNIWRESAGHCRLFMILWFIDNFGWEEIGQAAFVTVHIWNVLFCKPIISSVTFGENVQVQ